MAATAPQEPATRPLAVEAAGICCENCQQLNPIGKKFCGGCGHLLEQICVECRGVCQHSDVFCGNCGVNLIDALRSRVALCESQLAEATGFQSACAFDKAVELLRRLMSEDHPRLAPVVQRAKEAFDKLHIERAARTSEANAAYRAAQHHAANQQYHRARRSLESIPPALLTETICEFFENIRSIGEELDTLAEQIRTAVRAKKFEGLLPKVERLLELQPDDASAQRLAQQLRGMEQNKHAQRGRHLEQAARKKLAENQYARGLEYVQQIDPSAFTPELTELRDQLAELAWISSVLRTAPVADGRLVEMAERLVKLRPDDEQAAKLLRKLRVRAGEKPSDARSAASRWAKRPTTSCFGVAVDWFGGCQRIEWPDGKIAPAWEKNPGRFLTALGLALQGLGKSAVQNNLLVEEKQSVLNRLTKRRKTSDVAWGLDFSSSGLKAIKARWNESSQTVICEVCQLIEHQTPLNRPDTDRFATGGETIKSFLSQHDISDGRLCVSLPGTQVLTRFFDLPPCKPTKIPELIGYEAKMLIPLPLDLLSWDYHVVGNQLENDKSSHSESRQVMLIAAKRTTVQEHLTLFAQHGLQVDVVQSDCVALYNLLNYELYGTNSTEKQDADAHVETVLLVDIGCETTNVVLVAPHKTMFRSIVRGADDFTKTIMRDANLTYTQAEAVKRNPLLARYLHKTDQALEPAFAELAQEINRSIAMLTQACSDVSAERVYGAGGGFMTLGLFRHFRKAAGTTATDAAT